MNDNLSYIYQNDLVVTELKGDDFIDLFNHFYLIPQKPKTIQTTF